MSDQNVVEETEKLGALRRFGIVDAQSEPVFDEIARLASQICDAPMALVNLIEDGRQWFKAAIGLDQKETPLATSICAYAIGQLEPLFIVPDIAKHERFRTYPLVIGAPHLRFYAGAVLRATGGHAIGSLCVLDTKPRELTSSQKDALQTLGRQVMTQLELRLVLRKRATDLVGLRDSQERFQLLTENATEYAFVFTDKNGFITGWSKGAEQILGWTESEMIGQSADIMFTPEDRAAEAPASEREKASREGRAPDERWHLKKDGQKFFASGLLLPNGNGFAKIFRDVTDERSASESVERLYRQEKAARQEATENELRFRQLADAMPQIVWTAGPDGVLDYYNRRWFEYINREEGSDDVAWDRYIHPDDLPGVYDKWAGSIRSGDPYVTEFRVRRSEGAYRWFLVRALPVRDDAGNVKHWYGTCTDIDDQRHIAEERATFLQALQVQGEKLATIFHLAPAFICTLKGPEHVFELANQGYHDLMGTRDIIGKTVREALPEVEGQGYFELLDKVYQTGETSTGEEVPLLLARGPGKSLDRRFVSFVYQATRGVDGAVDGVFVHGVDVTSQVRAREALRISEERLRTVVETTPECVKIVRKDGSLEFMNPAGLLMIEADAEASCHGASVFGLVAPEFRQDWETKHRRVCEGEKLNWQFEIIGLRGTRRWMETHAVPIVMPGGDVAQLAVTRDISERRRIEIEREQLLESERAARSEAERVSQMKDEFLATLSHELRTPLNAILGWAQILQVHADGDEELQEGLEVIERNTKVQTQLIEDLLDMSRIISGKVRLDVQGVNLHDVIKAAIASVRHSAEAKEIRLQAVIDPIAGPVRGDPNRLQQCFWNLLSNAIKFTPKGGRVQVTIERVNSHVEVCVVDSGQGIKPEFLPHVFERFRQADSSTTRRHGGLGLGLSIVKHLVELHGGTVRAKSAGEGQGATFCIELPLMVVHIHEQQLPREHPRGAMSQSSGHDYPSLKGLTVLAIDDEPDARALLRRVLEDCGASVFLAASSKEGLAILQRERPDLILSDIGMPGEDGFEFIRQVRLLKPEEGGRTPAAALTAFARAEDRTRALRAGYQIHVSKPVEPAELTAVVASLAQRSG